MTGGIILLDKPRGLTSFDCDKIVRRASAIKKVGHSGTLDPFATGLLPVFTGDALKFMRYTDGYDKTYYCKAFFGACSDTGDTEGNIVAKAAPSEGDFGTIRAALEEVASRTTQIPPKYSAKKINGQKAYDLARRGVEFELKPNNIKVYSLVIDSMEAADNGVICGFTVHCSKGTYIRTICTDAGDVSGFGAYALELRRIKVGPFSVEDAVSADELEDTDITYTDPVLVLSDMPAVTLTAKNAEDIRCGRKIPVRAVEGMKDIEGGTLVKAMFEGSLAAVIYAEDGIIRIDRGFG